jgi:2-hydroxychromene-2-carboxylate isomerase
MMQAIEFWFDFVSPYAYIAAQSVEQLAARYGRTVNWQPVLLGAVFRETGSGPLTMRPPVMANYFRHDFERSARFAGLSLRLPDNFLSVHTILHVCLWLKQQAPHLTGEFVRRVTRAYFNGDVPVNDSAWLADLVSNLGLDGQSAVAACADPY